MNSDLLIFGVAAVPSIAGLVQVAKDSGLPVRFAPLASVAFGILAGLAEYFGVPHYPLDEAIVVGVGLGLAAGGAYSGATTTLSGFKQAKQP